MRRHKNSDGPKFCRDEFPRHGVLDSRPPTPLIHLLVKRIELPQQRLVGFIAQVVNLGLPDS